MEERDWVDWVDSVEDEVIPGTQDYRSGVNETFIIDEGDSETREQAWKQSQEVVQSVKEALDTLDEASFEGLVCCIVHLRPAGEDKNEVRESLFIVGDPRRPTKALLRAIQRFVEQHKEVLDEGGEADC